MIDSHEPPTSDSLSVEVLSRDDLAAVAAVHRRAHARFNRLGTLCFIGGLAIGVALLTLREPLGWPASLDPAFFFAGWVLGLGSAGIFWWRRRRALAGLHLQCFNCGESLFREERMGIGASRADLIVTTGRCPDCGHLIIDA